LAEPVLWESEPTPQVKARPESGASQSRLEGRAAKLAGGLGKELVRSLARELV